MLSVPDVYPTCKDAGVTTDRSRLARATLGAWVTAAAHETPQKSAVIARDAVLSYGQLFEKSSRLAQSLKDLGLAKGDVVGIQLPNMPEFVICHVAISMLGAVAALLHMPYRAGDLEPLLKYARVRAVICLPRTEKYDAPATLQGLKKSVPTLDFVIVAGSDAPQGSIGLSNLIATGIPGLAGIDPPEPEDPAVLAFTSGTSAAPKGVLRDYSTLLGNQQVIAAVYGLTSADRIFSAPPFTHIFGTCCLNLALCARGAIVLMPVFTPESFRDALCRATVVFAAPAHVSACLKAGSLAGADLSCVRLVGVAGSACPPELIVKLEGALPNATVGQLFGMTETLMTLVTPHDGGGHARRTTVGAPTPGIEVRIRADTADPPPPGFEGELEIRGYSVFRGYWSNPDATEQAFSSDGWFRTGDLATIDPAGNVALTGRIKDIINRGGIKFNPLDVELLLERHPGVRRAAVVPVPDEVLTERACLFVSLASGATLTLAQILDYLQENGVAKHRWPERLEVVAEMPMTATQKIKKGDLVKLLEPS
jgi:cyclohexanecarboxylate-CoA ligase